MERVPRSMAPSDSSAHTGAATSCCESSRFAGARPSASLRHLQIGDSRSWREAPLSDGGAGVSTHMAIEVRGLTKVFETGRRRRRVRVEAVHDISLGVEAGERIAYIGPNGAGKSTSIKMLTGILHPTADSADRRALRAAIATLVGVDAPRDAADAGGDLRHRRATAVAAGRRVGRAARGDRSAGDTGALPVAGPADAVRARSVHAPRAGHPVPRRADHRPRSTGEATVPRAVGAAQPRAGHHDLPDVARRG